MDISTGNSAAMSTITSRGKFGSRLSRRRMLGSIVSHSLVLSSELFVICSQNEVISGSSVSQPLIRQILPYFPFVFLRDSISFSLRFTLFDVALASENLKPSRACKRERESDIDSRGNAPSCFLSPGSSIFPRFFFNFPLSLLVSVFPRSRHSSICAI